MRWVQEERECKLASSLWAPGRDPADRTIAIEVKWTDRPSLQDVTGLVLFLRDHPHVREGYVVCRCPRPARLNKSIVALPWQLL